jgi:hypothetical protein
MAALTPGCVRQLQALLGGVFLGVYCGIVRAAGFTGIFVLAPGIAAIAFPVHILCPSVGEFNRSVFIF